MIRSHVISAASVAFALAVMGCSSSDGDAQTAGPSAATGCAADTRKDVYTAGLTKRAGSLSVKLVDAAPAPPSKGTNAMTIAVTDAAGVPVDGATVRVLPFMPDHGHGSAVTPVVAAAGAGTYTVSKVYFAMAGLWKVSITVETSSGTQEAVFQFCLDG